MPRRNRWKDLLPGSSSECETEGELNTTHARDRTIPKLKGPQLLYKGTEGSAAYDEQTPVAATVPPSETLVLDLSLSAAILERYALQQL